MLGEKQSRPQPSGDLPNVLIIMTDQHRHDLMTCAGRDVVPTPNIDRIAASGVRFTNAYCAYPVCVASRMAMLTGLYAHHTGAINNTDYLDWRYRTMAHHFSEHGYLTGLIGKMHFGDAHKHGFEYYMSINDWLMYLGPKVQHYADEVANNPLNPYFFRTVDDNGTGFPDVYPLWGDRPSPWVGHVRRYDFRSMASQLDAKDHLDMFVARESARFLRRYRDQRFFLIASLMKPHTPLFPPREWAERYPVEAMELPATGDTAGYPEHIRRRISNCQGIDPRLRKAKHAGYYGNLAFADHCIGIIYDALANEGLLDNTIVVYTSDHGEMDGEHGMYGKFCMFDPSVKVPLIVSYPRVLPTKAVTAALTEQLGLYSTLATLTGTGPVAGPTNLPIAGAPEAIGGHSFAEVLLEPARRGPEAIFSEYNLRAGVAEYMVRTERYKYVHNDGGSGDELYDLEADPGECVNQIDAAGLRGVREALRERLFGWYDPAINPHRTRTEGRSR